jgi:hypothetical protein
MPVAISDEVLATAHISEPELEQELAVSLFQRERPTPAQGTAFNLLKLYRYAA